MKEILLVILGVGIGGLIATIFRPAPPRPKPQYIAMEYVDASRLQKVCVNMRYVSTSNLAPVEFKLDPPVEVKKGEVGTIKIFTEQ